MGRQVSLTTVRILVALSLLLITAQLLLLFCHCKCRGLNDAEILLGRKVEDKPNENVIDCSQRETKGNVTGPEIRKLQDKIRILEKKLQAYQRLDKVLISQDISQLRKISHLDSLRSYTPKNEYDVIPFDSFTLSAVYGDIGTLSKNPAEAVSGRRGHEHNEVIRFAVNAVNQDVESKADPVVPFSLAEGIMRNDRLLGTTYELHFRSEIPDVFKRIKIIRPFGALEKIGNPETVDTSKEIINVIVPLSGRLDKFEEFMKRFVDVGIRYDRRVHLTVIYYGTDGREKIREILNQVRRDEQFDKYKVIFTDQEFSRGAALQKGAESWTGGNVLLFFCDVDVYFTADFLERCRLYSSPGKKVYYPIVYSQYNPVIVYGGQAIPPLKQQMKLSKDSGFWRDFGFGMTCQFRDDFFKVGGFDLSIKGWGMEDVKLYRKHLYSVATVIRAYDRGIFHIYHEKRCSKSLSDDQFISCLQSKAVSEGSHKQMGMLAFGKFLLGNQHPDWGKLLEASLSGAVEKELHDVTEDTQKQENGIKALSEHSESDTSNEQSNPMNADQMKDFLDVKLAEDLAHQEGIINKQNINENVKAVDGNLNRELGQQHEEANNNLEQAA